MCVCCTIYKYAHLCVLYHFCCPISNRWFYPGSPRIYGSKGIPRHNDFGRKSCPTLNLQVWSAGENICGLQAISCSTHVYIYIYIYIYICIYYIINLIIYIIYICIEYVWMHPMFIPWWCVPEHDQVLNIITRDKDLLSQLTGQCDGKCWGFHWVSKRYLIHHERKKCHDEWSPASVKFHGSWFRHLYHLVGVFNPSEKYESQLGWWTSQYMEK